jgi:predicted membrane-bound spermidine synthase
MGVVVPFLARIMNQRSPQPGLDDRLATVFAFAGSGCLLILEIVAGRLLAPILGVSLYTWTSVIGVVLAGISLGNYLGGRMADRWPSRSAVALIYFAGSLASLAILGLVRYAHLLSLPSGAPAIVQVIWLTAVLFFVPSTIVSAATPLLTRLSLHSVAEGGRVVGRIQAAAALGSIVGTFLTGFVLISSFGTRRIVAGVAVTLLLLALASRPLWPRGRLYGLALLLGVVTIAAGWVSHSDCERESDYYCIKVRTVTLRLATQPSGPKVTGDFKALYLDRLLHGIVNISDAGFLFYGYERLYADAIATLFPSGSSIDAFFLGGGEYAFPRYLESRYKGSIDVAEIDPAVTSIARSHLGLNPTDRMRIHHQDARRFLAALPPDTRFDVVLGDTFNDFQVPYQLTTREFNNLLARHMKDDGLYLLNVIDAIHNDFLRSEIRTLRETFPYVGVLALAGEWPPTENVVSTYVIVAARHAPRQPLASAVPTSELDAFVQKGYSVVLTDDYVPVDQLLAPVFSRELHPPEEQAPVVAQGSNPDEVMKVGLDLLYTRNDPAGAAAHFRRVLELNRTHYGATFQLAKALDVAGFRNEARPFWEKALQMAEGYHDEQTAGIARARLGVKP